MVTILAWYVHADVLSTCHLRSHVKNTAKHVQNIAKMAKLSKMLPGTIHGLQQMLSLCEK
jgi:hypothetical protein